MHKSNRFSPARVCTICPGQRYKADKLITCQFPFASFSLVNNSLNLYHSVTIGVAITSTALLLAPSIPREIKPLLGRTYFALASAMACRVFRALILGIIKDPHANAAVTRPADINHQNRADNSTTSKRDKTCLSSLVINVEVEMDTRADSYDGHTCWDGQSSKGDDKQHDVSDQV
jgi:hypothetical protein